MVKFNIAISGERGTEWEAVNGYIYPAGAPVFGIHCHKRGEWVVTHLETGRRASRHMCGSRGSAQLLVDALLTNPPLPWTPWPKTRAEQYKLYRFACECWNRCFPTDQVEPAPERKRKPCKLCAVS